MRASNAFHAFLGCLGPATQRVFLFGFLWALFSFHQGTRTKRLKTHDYRPLYSLNSHRPNVCWCDWKGQPVGFVGPRPSAFMVSSGFTFASPSELILRDPSSFVPGELHKHVTMWEEICPPGEAHDVLSYIRNGIDAWSFLIPYKGTFAGQLYDSPSPPAREFPNSRVCSEFQEFIDATISDRVRNGSLLFWGNVGEVQPPHLVMPITVEPTKPRMCHDERFLNLWVRDLPFSLDYISDLPRYIGRDHFQTVCDDKSGYDHLSLTEDSRTLFGLRWNNCYYVYTSLPFGWKASAYIYHTTGLVATNYIRSLNVPCSQYLDDRHIGQLVAAASCNWSDFKKAEAAAYIAASVLTALGYTLALSKSSLYPSQSVRFLGYICDSVRMAFILPEDKKEKFKSLRETVLSLEEVPVQMLQRFAGKTTSFSIAVPAARLYTRTVYRAIGKSAKKPLKPIRMSGDLLKEIMFWRFLDNWQGYLPWFDERHRVIRFFSDASNSGWGGVVLSHLDAGELLRFRDYWTAEDSSKPIVIKEALALQYALSAAAQSLRNCRVDAQTDSLPLSQAWHKQGGKSIQLNAVIKSIFEMSLHFNIALSLYYVPSDANLADAISRVLSGQDCMLASQPWKTLEALWGPHTIDLMSLDSNTQRGQDGMPLRHFSPWPTPGSSGINLFSQSLDAGENAYVFPPLALVGPVLRFLLGCGVPFTIIIPDVFPRRFWWPLISGRAADNVKLGCKGEIGFLLYPTRDGVFNTIALPWDLWAFRMS